MLSAGIDSCPKCGAHPFTSQHVCNQGDYDIKKSHKTGPTNSVSKLTASQKAWTLVGKIAAGVMALGCGISTAAAFVTLHLVSGGIATYSLAVILFLAGSGINWYIFKSAVPKVLIDLFGGEKYFQGLLEVEGGCEILTEKEPTFENIYQLNFTKNAAYILVGETLYYVNRNRREIKDLKITSKQLQLLASYKITFDSKAKEISYSQSQIITDITGHHPLSKARKGLMGFGIFAALSVGITFGALTFTSTFSLTAAFGFLAVISAGFPPIAAFLAVATFICLTALMLKDIADLIKTENIAQKCTRFIKKLFDITSSRSELIVRNTLPSIEELQSFENESIFIKVADNLYYFNKENMSKIEDLGVDPNLAGSENRKLKFDDVNKILTANGKYKVRNRATIYLSRIVSTILTIAFIPFAIFGLYMTMNACAPGVKAILLTIPKMSLAAAEVITGAIALGFAFVGQIVFTINTVIKSTGRLFRAELTQQISEDSTIGKSIDQARTNYNNSKNLIDKTLYFMSLTGLYTIAVINAVGNGLISMVGAATSGFFLYAAGIGGFINSAAAGFASIHDALAANEKEAKEAAKPNMPGHGHDANNGSNKKRLYDDFGPSGSSSQPGSKPKHTGNDAGHSSTSSKGDAPKDGSLNGSSTAKVTEKLEEKEPTRISGAANTTQNQVSQSQTHSPTNSRRPSLSISTSYNDITEELGETNPYSPSANQETKGKKNEEKTETFIKNMLDDIFKNAIEKAGKANTAPSSDQSANFNPNP